MSQQLLTSNELGNITSIGATAAGSTLSLIANNTTAVTIDTSQRVGIGQTSPSYLLDVANTGVIGSGGGVTLTSSYTNALAIRGSSSTTAGSSAIHLGDNFNSSSRQWTIVNGFSALGSLNFVYGSAQNTNPLASGSTAMTLNNSGYLGIGTSSPSTVLTVAGTVTITGAGVQMDNGQAINMKNASGTLRQAMVVDGSSNLGLGGTVDSGIIFYTSLGNERARFSANGRLSIGNTDSTQGQLNIVASNAYLTLRNNNNSGKNFGKVISNGGTGSQVVTLFTITGWQSGNSRLFGVVTIYSVNPILNQGNKTEAWFFANQAGTTAVGSMTGIYDYGSMSLCSLSWSGSNLQITTPSAIYAVTTVDIQWVAGDGVSISYNV